MSKFRCFLPQAPMQLDQDPPLSEAEQEPRERLAPQSLSLRHWLPQVSAALM